jgi:PAS domain S-box-containing protein
MLNRSFLLNAQILESVDESRLAHCSGTPEQPADPMTQLQNQLIALQAQLNQETLYRQQVESSLRESQICLRLLSIISKSTAAGRSAESVITHTVEQMGHYFNDRRITYAIVNQGILQEKYAISPQTPEFERPTFQIALTDTSHCWQLLHRHQAVIVEDVHQEPMLNGIAADLDRQQVRSLLIMPLLQLTPALGVLCFDMPNAHTWSPYEIATLAEIVDYLGIVIQEAFAQQERKRAEEQLHLLESVVVNAKDAVMITVADLAYPRILYANAAFTRSTGYSLLEVLDQTPRILQGPKTDRAALDRIRTHLEKGIAVEAELINYRKDGSEFWVDLNIVPIPSPEGRPEHFVAIQRDITERKHTEARINASLKEKEVLLKEIHHRVKNNLQVVSSLLKLQSGHLKKAQESFLGESLDPSIAAFQDSQQRVRAMALIHEKLYQSKDLARTDFSSYVRSLVQDLLRSYSTSICPIQVRSTIHEVHLSLDAAIPCGLIINELVSNALKYAFPGDSTGEVEIQLYPDRDDQYVLIVQDNGIGLTQGIDLSQASTLGLQLVCSLTEQLGGTVTCQTPLNPKQPGTSFRITFADSPVQG